MKSWAIEERRELAAQTEWWEWLAAIAALVAAVALITCAIGW